MKLSSFALAGALLLAGAPAGAISRVGNSSIGDTWLVDEALGFTTRFPQGLYNSRELPDDGLELVTSPRFVNDPGRPGFRSLRVQLRSFRSDFGQMANWTQEQVRGAFLGMNSDVWWEGRAADPCVLVFLSERGNLHQLVTTWGAGKGLVVFGEKDADVQRAMRQMLGDLRLDQGACAWQ